MTSSVLTAAFVAQPTPYETKILPEPRRTPPPPSQKNDASRHTGHVKKTTLCVKVKADFIFYAGLSQEISPRRGGAGEGRGGGGG